MTFNHYKMKELISDISMGPFGSNIKTDCYQESGVPYLNGSNLMGVTLVEDKFNYISEEKANELGRAVAQRGDVIVTHRGTLGQISYIPPTSKYKRYVTGNSQFRFSCNKLLLPEYIVYYFHSRKGQHTLLSNSSRVGVPALARPTSSFQTLDVEIPDVDTQKRIVKILSSLDDKIELNNKINANLQQQAQALFKSWLSSNDFEYVPLASIADINPESLSSKDTWNLYRYLDTSSITSNVISEVQTYSSVQDLPSRAKRKVKSGDIVYSNVRPNQNHFGLIFCNTANLLVSTGFSVIRCKDSGICNEFIYLFLTQKEVIEEFQQLAEQSASTFPAIKPSDIGAKLIPYSAKIAKILKPTLTTLFAFIQKNNEENRHLAELRDTLLPKLMSGELDVSDIELSEVSDA